ncbi:MAG: MlaE family ABC transporter permease [Planctomycetota bacterium]
MGWPKGDVMARVGTDSGNVFTTIGAFTLGTLSFVGGIALLLKETLGYLFIGPFRRRPVRAREFFGQAVRVGPRSLGVVFLVNFFIGLILALIGGNILEVLGFTQYTGNLMSVGVVLELGPLLTGIIMTGFIGAALAAEIGTMVVSEEITAMETMALNPVRYVVAPRLLATILMVPCVTLLGDMLGILGGLIVAVGVLDLSSQVYFDQAWDQLTTDDVWRGLLKATVFGTIIGSVGCYQGFQVKGGAEGVGRVTTNAVVTSIIAIIITDAILNYFLLFRL